MLNINTFIDKKWENTDGDILIILNMGSEGLVYP